MDEKKAYFDNERFYNYKDDNIHAKKSFLRFLKWQFARNKTIETWPEYIENNIYPKPEFCIEGDQVKATFVNHSTVLIQTQGINILTDPVWSERVSPFKFLGPKRVRKPGVDVDDLPPIDLILVSHDHYDHLDIDTLKILDKKFKPIIISGCNINKILDKHNLNCIELNWWEMSKFKDLEIYFLPAKHWSGRYGFFGNNSTLWGSFLIKSKTKQIYFAGDTAYSKHIKMINDKFGSMDLSLLPIGAYKPSWIMSQSHTTPREAVIIHEELESKNSIAIHYGTFRLSDESYDDPVNDLKSAINELNVKNPFYNIDLGQSLVIL